MGRDKLWLPLAGRITLARTLDVFHASPLIDAIVVVTNTERMTDTFALRESEHWHKIAAIVPGGTRRQDSVRLGLEALAEHVPTCRWVLIHDAARPFVTPTILNAGMEAVQRSGASIAAVPVKDTIKHVENGVITATPDRSLLWAVQTPQIFSFPLISSAHQSPLAQEDVTDDATLLERLGHPVTIFPGSYTNIKITTPEDLLFAEAFLQKLQALEKLEEDKG